VVELSLRVLIRLQWQLGNDLVSACVKSVLTPLFDAWADHYVEERENAKLTPAQREYKKECQSRQCI
jgi:hypothetical protein